MNNRIFHLTLTLSFVLNGLMSIYAQPELKFYTGKKAPCAEIYESYV
jgi:hypothetical protein